MKNDSFQSLVDANLLSQHEVMQSQVCCVYSARVVKNR